MLPNLPEDSLYNLLPAGLQDEDERSIIRALIGGFQDRLSDFRFVANALTDLMDPEKCAPAISSEQSYTESILVTDGGVGITVTLSRYADRVESVTLNGEALTRSDVLAASTSYAVTDDETDTVIRFGDGTNGALVPDASTVEVTYTCITGRTLEVAYTTDYGKTVYRTLDITTDTPATIGERRAWAAEQMNIDQAAITSLTEGTDPLRVISGSALSHLAQTIGGVLYRDPTHTDTQAIAEWRRQIAAVLPRVRIKGTAKSFDVLGRLIGFSAARVVPLWGRVSPRLPNDPGDSVNDPDYKTEPQIPLESTVYDRDNISDGPFYVWDSAVMSDDDEETNFIPYVVNGLNPFIQVVVASNEPELPEAGYYTLGNGTSNVSAYVDLNSSVRVTALGTGEGFNGLRIEVIETDEGRSFRVQARLSKVKYRTSLYELALMVNADEMRERYGLEPVTDNEDAFELSGDCPNGKPLMGGWSNLSRYHAPPDTQQHRTSILNTLGVQAVQAMEAVRPATRFPRRVSTGLCLEDDVLYAPVQNTILTGTIGTAYRRPLSVPSVGSLRRFGTYFRAGTYAYADEQNTVLRTAMHTARIMACDPYSRDEQLSELVGRNVLANDDEFTGSVNIDTGIYNFTRLGDTEDTAQVTVEGAEFVPSWVGDGPVRFFCSAVTTTDGSGYVTLTVSVYADSARTILLHEQSSTGGTPGEVPSLTWSSFSALYSRVVSGSGEILAFTSGEVSPFIYYVECTEVEQDAPGNFVKTLDWFQNPDLDVAPVFSGPNGTSYGSIYLSVSKVGVYEIRSTTGLATLPGVLSGMPLCPDGLDFEIIRTPPKSLEVEWHPTSTEVIRTEPIGVQYRSGFVASVYNGSFDGRTSTGTAADVDYVDWKHWPGDAYVRFTGYGTGITAHAYRNPDSTAVALTSSNFSEYHGNVKATGLIDLSCSSLDIGSPHNPKVTDVLLQRDGTISGVVYQDRPEDELRIVYDSLAFTPSAITVGSVPAQGFTGYTVYGVIYDSSDFYEFYEIELGDLAPTITPGMHIAHFNFGEYWVEVVAVSPGTLPGTRIVQVNQATGTGIGPDIGETIHVLIST